MVRRGPARGEEGGSGVSAAIENTLLPVVNVWAVKEDVFNAGIMDELAGDVADAVARDDADVVNKLAVIGQQVPFVVHALVSRCPADLVVTDDEEEERSKVPSGSDDPSTLDNLLGAPSSRVLEAFSQHISQEWFPTWPQVTLYFSMLWLPHEL